MINPERGFFVGKRVSRFAQTGVWVALTKCPKLCAPAYRQAGEESRAQPTTMIHLIVTALVAAATLYPSAAGVTKADVEIRPEVKEIREVRNMWVTAYSSEPEQTDDTPFITASGTRVRDGIVATNELPIGTKVRIPAIYGDKIFIVEDRMHQRMKNKIDIWMTTREQALRFGIKKAEIVVLQEI